MTGAACVAWWPLQRSGWQEEGAPDRRTLTGRVAGWCGEVPPPELVVPRLVLRRPLAAPGSDKAYSCIPRYAAVDIKTFM